MQPLTQDSRRAEALNDLYDLVANINEPRERFYLKETCIQALERLGHDPMVAQMVAGDFFKRTLQ